MPAIQPPIWYPPTQMDKEANALLRIRSKVRTPVGGGAPNQFLGVNATSGEIIRGAARVGGGSFQPSGTIETGNFS